MTFKELLIEEANHQIQKLEEEIELEKALLTPEELEEEERKHQAFREKMMKIIQVLNSLELYGQFGRTDRQFT